MNNKLYAIKKHVVSQCSYLAFIACMFTSQHIIARPPILKGSSVSLDVQNHQAQKHKLKFHKDNKEIYDSVSKKKLVAVSPSKSLELAGVSLPFALESTRNFLKSFSKAYQSHCQESLVVTSLTRTLNRQPKNASARSVHPTGLAIDLRIPNSQKCKAWLVDSLVYLEEQKVVEATQERNPPHFHLVVFPNAYQNFTTQKRSFGKRYESISDDFSNQPTQNANESDEQEAVAHSEGQWIESDQELIVLAPESSKNGKSSAEQDELIRQIEEAEDIRGLDNNQDDDSDGDGDSLALSQSQQNTTPKAVESKPEVVASKIT